MHARQRMASHRLEIEAGRWHKPNRTPVEGRKCFFFFFAFFFFLFFFFEDEFHFVIECPFHQDLLQELH